MNKINNTPNNEKTRTKYTSLLFTSMYLKNFSRNVCGQCGLCHQKDSIGMT